MSHPLDIRALRLVQDKIEQLMLGHATMIADGGVRNSPMGNIAEAYCEAVGYRRGLNDALMLLDEAEHQLLGTDNKRQG